MMSLANRALTQSKELDFTGNNGKQPIAHLLATNHAFPVTMHLLPLNCSIQVVSRLSYKCAESPPDASSSTSSSPISLCSSSPLLPRDPAKEVHRYTMVSNGAIDTATSKQASSMAPNAGKATILALGHAFPQQLVMQDFVVDGFMKNTNCHDPELKEKLTRLCNKALNYLALFFN